MDTWLIVVIAGAAFFVYSMNMNKNPTYVPGQDMGGGKYFVEASGASAGTGPTAELRMDASQPQVAWSGVDTGAIAGPSGGAIIRVSGAAVTQRDDWRDGHTIAPEAIRALQA